MRQTFIIRASECDAYNHLNNVAYVRYVLDTLAVHAPHLGAGWVVISEEMDYSLQLKFGETVECVIERNMADENRQVYAFACLNAGGQIAASGVITFGRIGASDFVEPKWADAKVLLPQETTVPDVSFPVSYTVIWQQMDIQNRLRLPWYVFFFQDVAMEMSKRLNWSALRMQEHTFGIIVKRRQLELFTPAMLDDELEVHTWYTDPKRISVTRHFAMLRKRDKTLLARASMLYVWINTETGRPRRILPEFISEFEFNWDKSAA